MMDTSRLIDLINKISNQDTANFTKLMSEIKNIKKQFNKLESKLEKIEEAIQGVNTAQATSEQTQKVMAGIARIITLAEADKTPAPRSVSSVAAPVSPATSISSKSAVSKPVSTPAGRQQAINDMKTYLTKNKTIYDVKILNCFIVSTISVMENYLTEKPKFIKPEINIDKYTQPYLSGKMSLKGTTSSGELAVSFTQTTIEHIARQMFGFTPTDDVAADLAEDVAKELCNQICGQAKVELGTWKKINLPKLWSIEVRRDFNGPFF